MGENKLRVVKPLLKNMPSTRKIRSMEKGEEDNKSSVIKKRGSDKTKNFLNYKVVGNPKGS